MFFKKRKPAILTQDNLEQIKAAKTAEDALSVLKDKELNSSDKRLLKTQIQAKKKDLDKLKAQQKQHERSEGSPDQQTTEIINSIKDVLNNLKVAKNQANAVVKLTDKVKKANSKVKKADKKLNKALKALIKIKTKLMNTNYKIKKAEKSTKDIRQQVLKDNLYKGQILLTEQEINQKYSSFDPKELKNQKKELAKQNKSPNSSMTLDEFTKENRKLDLKIKIATSDVKLDKHIARKKKLELNYLNQGDKIVDRKAALDQAKSKLTKAEKNKNKRIAEPKYERSSVKKLASKIGKKLGLTGSKLQIETDQYASKPPPQGVARSQSTSSRAR